jgi:hypothetical protein
MSLKESKDVIERLYSGIILLHFPNYEVFWGRFIGNPKQPVPKPYEYKFPQTMNTDQVCILRDRIEKIQIVHYSIFCQLAGSHYQLGEMKSSLRLESAQRYFGHWEHFEAAYMHLGSIFYMLTELWNILLKSRKPKVKFDYAFLLDEGQTELSERYARTQEKIKTLRDVLIHRGRAFTSFQHSGNFYIPLEITYEIIWSSSIKLNEMIDTVHKLEEDLADMESLLNELHVLLIKEFEQFLSTNKIEVVY